MWTSSLKLFQQPCSCLQLVADWTDASIHLISCHLDASPDATCRSTWLADLLGWIWERDKTALSWSTSEPSNLHLLCLVVGLLLLHLLLASLLLLLPQLFNTVALLYNRKCIEATKTSKEESSSSDSESSVSPETSSCSEDEPSSSIYSDKENKLKANEKTPSRMKKKSRRKKKAASSKKSSVSSRTRSYAAGPERVATVEAAGTEGATCLDSLREDANHARCFVILPEYVHLARETRDERAASWVTAFQEQKATTIDTKEGKEGASAGTKAK